MSWLQLSQIQKAWSWFLYPAHPQFSIRIAWIGGMVESAYIIYNANPKKCTFHTDMVEYLGFILSPEGLHMDPAKVLTIQAWPVPHNVHEVQSFLGFTNFYQHFISGYTEFTQPLTNLCRKNTPWHFGEPESTAFQHLKTAFRVAPVLYHWAPV